jgi:hypothetical protein
MGMLAMPSLIAQALSPSVGAIVLQDSGTERMLGAVVTIALVNLIAMALLLGSISSRKYAGAAE